MAKKKPPAEPEKVTVSVTNFKGTPSYRDWLAERSKSTRYPAVTILRMALAEWAEKHGHPAPPEK